MSTLRDAPDLGTYTSHGGGGDSDDEIFAELEREVEALNEADTEDAARVTGSAARDGEGDLAQAFQEMAARMGADTSDPDRGKYKEVKDEKELLRTSIREPRCVIHFAKKEFRRCQILDRHLEHLARQHPNTLFVKVDVENTPFLVDKLHIRVLPCIMAFVNGISKDKLIGFESFGNSDSFTTAALEWRLGQTGVIVPQQKAHQPILGFGVASSAAQDTYDDDEWD
ncbi:hypothetical protein ACI68E_004364 [Malassezia pachydermatis]